MIVTLHTIQGSGLDVGATAKRQAIGFTVEGLQTADLGGFGKEEALHALQAAVQAQIVSDFGGIVIPNHPELILSRIVCGGFTDAAGVGQAIFESTPFGGEPSTYIITDRSTLVIRESTVMPGTGVPFQLSWAPENGKHIDGVLVNDVNKYPIVPLDKQPMRFKFPHRVIGISALIYGHPIAGQQHLGECNDASWPTGSYASESPALPIGYWQLADYATRWSKYAGYFQLESAAESKVIEDWSEYQIMVDKHTGKYVRVYDEVITAIRAPAYSYGWVRANGIGRACPYPTTSFPSIFGW